MNDKEKEFLKELAGFESEIPGASRYGVRNETIQVVNRPRRIGKLRSELKKKSKLLIMKEIAIPFSPYTGKASTTPIITETGDRYPSYNPKNKYRPETSVRGTISNLKRMYNNPVFADAKDLLLKRTTLNSWDTSNVDNFTEEDYEVSEAFTTARIMTLRSIYIKCKEFTGMSFPMEYAVNVQIDPETDSIVGDKPLPVKIHELMNAICYAELETMKDVKYANDEARKDAIKEVFKKNFIQEVRASNWLLALEIPLNGKRVIPENVFEDFATPEDMMKHIVFIKSTRRQGLGIGALIPQYHSDLSTLNIYPDFYEVDYACADEEDINRIGNGATFSVPVAPLKTHKNSTSVEELINTFSKTIDTPDSWESLFIKNSPVRKYDNSLDNSLLQAASRAINIDDPFLTDSVVKSHEEVLTLIFGDEIEDRLNEIALSENEGDSINQEEANKLGKEFANVYEEEEDEVDLDSVDLG